MTEQQTVTCRSVCERLVAHYPQTAWYVDGGDIIDSARLALGQPDAEDWRKLAQESGEANQRIREQLDAANKRAAEMAASSDEWFAKCEEANKRADAKDARLEESKRLASEWQKRAEEAELRCAALAGQRDGCDEELSRVRFLAEWLLDRLVARSAV